MIKNKIILITGAAGFIGSHLTEELLRYNNYLILIDNFNEYYEGKENNIQAATNNYQENKDFKLYKEDLTNKACFKKIKISIDYIFHLAAQAGVRYSIVHATEISHNNIESTLNVFEFAINKDVEKIIYASSSSVYGNPIYTPVDENHPKNPISPYAISKYCGEIYADYYFRERDLPITSLRFYTVYGPRGRPDMAIRKFFNAMLKNETITIYGDGNQLRDFTYISDIINGLILAAENKRSSGEVFNLGCSNPISVNALVEKMHAISKKPKKIVHVEKQEGDVDITHSDILKAKKILGYFPKVNIDEGLRYQWEWQQQYIKSLKNI
ncbi:MAG: NAD-dependent epimerase/dehydratase family protein [Promethearchaeota archaeon]